MKIDEIIEKINQHLNQTFETVNDWFAKDNELRSYQPQNGGWNINQVLEHISLTNHFLLILIEKGTKKSLKLANEMDLKLMLQDYDFQWDKFNEVGVHLSFEWIRPQHMEPSSEKPFEEIQLILHEQVQSCQKYLELLKNGEGILYKTTMTVNDLGKIDVYQYIYFLVKHAERHIVQMLKIEQEFDKLRC